MLKASFIWSALLLMGLTAVVPARDKTAALIQKVEREASFSFVYNGKPSKALLYSWKRRSTRTPLNDGREMETTTWKDPGTGLEVTRELIRFETSPSVEIMLRLRNTGRVDTPILEKILPLDLSFTPAGTTDAIFHHVLGSAIRSRNLEGAVGMHGMDNDYTAVPKQLAPKSETILVHYVMRNDEHEHVESYLPFFNLQWQTGGLIGAIGWTGQWWVRAARGETQEVALKAGQETTHLILHPGESIRTPRVLLVQWSGNNRILGHNLLRRLLVKHYVPRINGEVQTPPVSHITAYVLIFDDIAQKTGKNPLTILPTLKQKDLGAVYADPGAALNWVTEENQLDLLKRLPAVGLEAYWLDAGWFEGLWPGGRGSWIPKKEFPNGLRPISDAAHNRGLKFLLWFDPEGVARGSRIDRDHPEWVLHHPKEGFWGGIFKWSDPAALRYMTELIAGSIRDWEVDIFRNDRNISPMMYWRKADTPERQGMTEIRQIEGLYSFWDALLKEFPNLTIDNANWRVTGPDLEAMKRTLGSLTRSELTTGGLPLPVADQAQTAELSLWVPLHSTLLNATDPYNFRSTGTTGVGIGLNLASPYVSSAEMQKAIAEMKELRPCWLGDYYPLTRIGNDENSWCGWQFNRPDLGEGFAVFFRRSKSPESSFNARLQGLDSKAHYDVALAETYDVKEKHTMTGMDLSRLRIEISSAPGTMMVRYIKQGRRDPRKSS